MEREEQGKNICETFDQLINTDDEFLNNKTKLYCEYTLSLGKEYVNSISNDFYEECENYLKKFSSNEEKEKQFIKSYESNLAKEGKEICKEVESIGVFNNELLIEKAVVYCQFISRQKDVDLKLREKCQNYIDNANNLYHYKSTFNKISYDRREKSYLDMRNIKIK